MKKVIFLISILFVSSLMGEGNISENESFDNAMQRYNEIKSSQADINVETKSVINSIDKTINATPINKNSINYYLDENSSIRFYKFSLVLLLSITALLSLWIILKYVKVSKNNDNVFRLSAIILILFMLGVIVTIAEDTTQISSVVGLLGAIAGYFLKEGKEALVDTINENTDNENTDK